ncbi:MAG: nuclear transport factor 2 family protein [Candidatus Competibacteraceae bacterium]|jgi:ketosteroid isomerase-like protein|nr:nuclear transport factor 2 family protein [Candidatus Competibacteraceae bacterium]
MMKRLGLLVFLCWFAAGISQAQEVDQSIKDGVKALWEAQQKAFDNHDVDGVMATYADSDDIMLMGTGPGEHWVGKEEVKDAYSNFMKGFDANTVEAKCGEGAGSARGDVVWLTIVCHFKDQKQGENREFVLNLSGVIVKQGEDWRYHTIHFSHLMGNPEQAAK